MQNAEQLQEISPPKHSLEEAKRRFAHWRETRPKRRGRIPAELWQTAIGLIGPYSLNEVSRALNLNHTDLKKRHEAQCAGAPPLDHPLEPRFVELACTEPVSRVSDCVMEVEGREGRKLKLTIRDESAGVDLLALAKGLWELSS